MGEISLSFCPGLDAGKVDGAIVCAVFLSFNWWMEGVIRILSCVVICRRHKMNGNAFAMFHSHSFPFCSGRMQNPVQ